jgi:hypothetical protein
MADVDASWLEGVELGEEVVPAHISSRLSTLFGTLAAKPAVVPA